MVNIKTFIAVLKLTEETAGQLGLESLTPTDRYILTAIWDKHESQKDSFVLQFDGFARDCENDGMLISKAQFYKSIRRFLSMGIILKLGGERSCSYTFVK